MSASIIPFLPQSPSLSPEAVQAMDAAYDKLHKKLYDGGQPRVVSEIIAKRIIEIAAHGERDPNKICERVLTCPLQTEPRVNLALPI
jgi:hypothetical protein